MMQWTDGVVRVYTLGVYMQTALFQNHARIKGTRTHKHTSNRREYKGMRMQLATRATLYGGPVSISIAPTPLDLR